MKYYVEAFREDGGIILGVGEGQGIIYAKNYKRTTDYKLLIEGKFSAKVAYHEIMKASTREVVQTILQNKVKKLGMKIIQNEEDPIREEVTLTNLFTKRVIHSL